MTNDVYQLKILRNTCEVGLELTKVNGKYRPANVYTFSLDDDTVIEYRRLNPKVEPIKTRSGRVSGYGQYWGPWTPIKII